MFKKIAVGLVGLVVLFVLVVATRPTDFKYERSLSMPGTAASAYALVEDFHNWPRWSPWDGLDPNQKRTFGGAARGEGSIFEWDGNDKVGAGRMTITRAVPDQLIEMKLEFLRPFAATNHVALTVKPGEGRAGEVTVTWTMTGQNGFGQKAAGLFMDMDKMLGDDFSKGLSLMKGDLAADATKAAADADAKQAVEAQKAAAEAAGTPDAGTP